jgi:hypothetical protein
MGRMTTSLDPLTQSFTSTRTGLHALACFAIAPARKALTGRIGLRAVDGAFGTPLLPDGSRVLIRGDRLIREPGGEVAITTVRAAAAFLSVSVSADPGVGGDLPPFEPDAPLSIDPRSSSALGAWYSFGADVLARVGGPGDTVAEAQLWPEHFDLATVVTLAEGADVNVGVSPGDSARDTPYLYVGPHSLEGLTGSYWNAPFGALLDYGDLATSASPNDGAIAFVTEGLDRVRAR